MARQAGLFDIEERLRELSSKGDDLERVNALVDFEAFRSDLERAVPRSDRAKGGRPPYDHVLMFRILILQASHSLSDERTEYLIKDRLSFMRFLGLSLADRVPDANSIWTFREALTRARIGGVSAIEALFRRFEAQLSAAGYIAMGGQIVDATVVAAPKQRNTEDEKRALKEGRIPEAWAQKPAKLAPEGPRRALDGEILQGQAIGGRREARRHRHPDVRLQEPCRHRPPPRADPHLDRPRPPATTARSCRACSTRPAPAAGSGRTPQSLGEEQGASHGQRIHQPYPPQEAAGQADAEACLPRQCRQVGGPCPRRARLRPPEGPHGAGHPHHRAREGDGENRAREPRVQHAPHGLARRRLTATPPPSRPARRAFRHRPKPRWRSEKRRLPST